MNHRHDRRTFLKTTSGLLLGPALGMSAITARAAASCPDVIVGTWGGDYETLLEKNIGVPIIKAAGGNVTYDTADQVSRMTKMRAEKTSRRGSMDVSCLVDTDMFDMSRADVLQPVDASMVPNNANTMEQFRKPYSIPHIFSAMVIVYNPTKITQAPDSFNLALDPRLKGRVGLSDILYAYVGMTASLAAGDHKAGFAAGTKFLRELKKNQPKVYPSNEALAAALKNGDVWMTCMWKARALQWKKAGVPVEFAFSDRRRVAGRVRGCGDEEQSEQTVRLQLSQRHARPARAGRVRRHHGLCAHRDECAIAAGSSEQRGFYRCPTQEVRAG